MSYLSVHNFSLRTEDRLLLNNLDFQLEKASILAIVGHNGAGKTTFLKALLGQALFKGCVRFNEKEFDYKSIPNQLNAAYLSQQHEITFDLPVKEIVVMGRYRHTSFFQNYTQEDYLVSTQALNKVGLNGFEERSFLELSGGEQQLVLLAQLITQDVDIFLLDEPTQSLDIKNKGHIMEVLKGLNQEGKTIIFSTHDLDYLQQLSGHFINFSAANPQLEIIDSKNLEATKHFLMSS